MEDIHDRDARLYLLRAAEPPAPAVLDYVERLGAVAAAHRIRRGTAPELVGRQITRQEADITADRRAIDDGLARVIVPGDAEWPSARLADLRLAGLVPPLALWIRGTGSLAEATASAVTITGTRAATSYGSNCATDFGYQSVQQGLTVVSGGGYGIDEATQRGALAAGGVTIAVLACGVDVAYPLGNAGLLSAISTGRGLLVSESPLGAVPSQRRFRARVRLLAALAGATVIIEAGQRSGALTVAASARALHRLVYAVPGPITSVTSRGSNELLRTAGAMAITAAEQLPTTGMLAAAAGPRPTVYEEAVDA